MTEKPSLIPADAVLLHSESGSKAAIIAEALEALSSIDPDQAMAVIMEREKLGSTGIGHGIAIPHGRLPDLETPITALIRHEGGIDFDAIDGQPVHIVVILLAPMDEDRSHLELLAGLARTLQKETVRRAVMEARTAEEISSLFAIPASTAATASRTE